MINNKIDLDCLAFSIYSINKYAKNYRDDLCFAMNQEYDYKKQEMEYLYSLKEDILKLFEPHEVHKQIINKVKKVEVPEGNVDFKNIKGKAMLEMDFDTGLYRKFKVRRTNKREFRHYLYYEIAGFKFHLPVSEKEVESYKDLKLVMLPRNFQIDGESPWNLMDKNEAIKNIKNFIEESSD